MENTQIIELGKQLEDARNLAEMDARYVRIHIDDLYSLQKDIADIKRLLFRGDSNFTELALKAANVENKLALHTNKTLKDE